MNLCQTQKWPEIIGISNVLMFVDIGSGVTVTLNPSIPEGFTSHQNILPTLKPPFPPTIRNSKKSPSELDLNSTDSEDFCTAGLEGCCKFASSLGLLGVRKRQQKDLDRI